MRDRRSTAPRSDLTLREVRVVDEGVAFDGVVAGDTFHFLLESQVLDSLAGSTPPGDPLQQFERRATQIRGVAGRLISAGVRGERIVLKAGFFGQSG